MATDAIIKTNVKYGSYFWVQWSVREQDAARNKTVILWSCGLHPEEQYYTNAIRMSAVVINGRTVYSGGTYSDITDYREETFASGTMEIDHEGDGSKTFTVSAFSGWLYGNGDYNAPAQSFELPTIPRATVPSMGAATIGEEVTISLPRASGTFTHTLTYSFGSASGTIGSALGTSAVWRLPESLATQIPHDPGGTGTLTCVTYSGSTLIGSKTIAFTASVPGSMKPALTPGWATVTYDNSGTKASAIRAWVQGYSKARAEFDDSRITCKQGASVRGYSITYLGKTVSESPYRTETMGGTAATVRCTVTDSRGLSAYEDFEIAIHPYAPPALTGARLYRADGDGAASDSGTHIAGRATANYSSIGGENAATIRGYWKAVGGSYGSGEALSSGVTGIISGSAVISADRSYVAKLVITDSLGNTAEFEDSIPTERVAFHLKEGGNGAAFGKAAEHDELLDVAWDARFREDVQVDGALQVGGKSLLDMVYPVGSIYLSVSGTDPQTLFGGTWEQIQGKFLLGMSSSYPAGSQGGEAEHALTLNEIPEHRHYLSQLGNTYRMLPSTHAADDPNREMPTTEITSQGPGYLKPTVTWGGYLIAWQLVDTPHDLPHNNMPPYLAVYIWKRTA